MYHENVYMIFPGDGLFTRSLMMWIGDYEIKPIYMRVIERKINAYMLSVG